MRLYDIMTYKVEKRMNIMFLKRLAAIVLTLVLIAQLTACRQESPHASNNDSQPNTSTQTENNESSSQSALEKDNQDVDEEHRDDSKNEVSANTTPNNNQNVNNSQQTESSAETDSDNYPVSSEGKTEKPALDTAIRCNHTGGDPYQNISKSEFYANYKVSCCNLDATYRSKHGFLSGSLNVPGQYAKESENQPMSDGKYIRNTSTIYIDNGNTYIVLDANGNAVMRIHKAGGYITLEEVAAYMYAFGGNGTIPANYTSKKSGKPGSSIWGEYLRVNHSYFIGDTDRYPYEPELPDISGCGGDLRYYEMDIGTTGTTTPGYPPEPYIEGNSINRGAARIVYARQDLNHNGIYENNEVYVFYTHNHYNDFREYLNYYGGWGKMFGNVTGGGTYSSKNNANPTPYVPTAYKNFAS